MKQALKTLFSSKKASVKKAYNTALAATFTSAPGMAFAGGGLNAATTQANDIQRWIYTFLGVVCLGYLSWKVLCCLLEWDQWNNMPKYLAYVSMGGGSLAGATWAYNIFL